MEKKNQGLSSEEMLQNALVPDWNQPYQVPDNWVWTKVGAVCVFERGITFPSSAKETTTSETLIPCLRTTNVQENLEIDDLIYVDQKFIKGNQAKFVRQEDIIMSAANSRELVGKVCYVKDVPFPMTFGGFVLMIRAQKVYSKLLFYMLRLEFLSGNFKGKSTQTTNIANISTTTLKNYPFPLPPLAEQQRIVDRVESLFYKLDQAKKKAQTALVSFEKHKVSILNKAFAGELTKNWREQNKNIENLFIENIEQHISGFKIKDRKNIEFELKKITKNSINSWLNCTVGAVGIVSNGSTPSRKVDEYWNGEIPWVSSGEVKNNIIYHTKEQITELGYKNSSVKLLPKGTVLLAMIGEGKTRGQSAILDISATTNQNIASISLFHEFVNSKYLWYWLQKNYEENRKQGNGSGQQALNCQKVRELDFILPTLSEQTEIVRILDGILDKEKKAKELVDIIGKINLIKQVVLTSAFQGKLGTNDSKEESAKELLRSILEDRTNNVASIEVKGKEKRIESLLILEEINMPKTILELLSEHKSLTPEKLKAQTSIKDIDDFYTELKKLVDTGVVKERREGNESYLEVNDADRQA
jgi:type I restriction enzyme S subunit